ncbi:MAG: ribosome-associated translation inhibitor RaiA [Cyanobacteria bacterium J06588_5]
MKLIIQGKNIEITEAIRDRINQKIGKAIAPLSDVATKVDVELSVPTGIRGQPQQVTEVTVFAKNSVIRAEKRHENLYASIDLVSDKIARQAKRFKDRQQKQRPLDKASSLNQITAPIDEAELDVSADLFEERVPELPPKVVRNKFFSMPPMSVQDALDNLQLVDHDFYVFQNAQTQEINVVYERNHGGYGVIQPRKAV